MKLRKYHFLFLKNKMAEKEKKVVKKQEEVSKSDNAKNDISDFNNEQIENGNCNIDVNYTHPIVTERKGFIDLTDYERNYEEIETYNTAQRSKRQPIKKSKGFINIKDQPEKEANGENISPIFPDENEIEKYTKESKKTTNNKEKHENDRINKSIVAKKDGDDVESKDVSEQITVLPEEAYVQHMERIIASKTLPSRDIEILQNLYARYNSDKKQTPTAKKIYIETDVNTSELNESKTDTRDQIEQPSTSEKEKVILDSSSKDLAKDILRSDMQDITETLTSIESPIPDDKKLESLENNLFVNKDKILTSTPKTNLVKKLNATSDLKNAKNDECDLSSMTIESPFSDFTLKNVELRTNLENSVVKEQNVLSDISKTLLSSIMPSNNEKIKPVDESKIILQFSEKKDLIETKENISKTESDEPFIKKMLLCHCIDVKMDTKNNGNNSNNNNNDINNNASIIERIRRYFLSLLIDYLVSSQIPNIKNKISPYY
ncbi:uncharacterized protein PF11_0207-like [Vespa crabro]|uniref:uncharacterized protein PF11_0207-like n=1 Tax=Vespa crabro TaxID=7445 RepID=UPI001F019211|nr:uncharacterized protein PF11_0207-like [Vespa crabro]